VWWRGRRARRLRVALGLALAGASVLVVVSRAQLAQRTIDQLGHLRTVPVARHELSIGHVIGAPDISWRALPVGAVPDGAVTGALDGRIVSVPVARGEVVVAAHLAPDGLRGLAALVPRGRRAVAVPLAEHGLTLEVGDRVDVVAPDRSSSGLDAVADRSGSTVARDATVLAVADASVVVAVEERDLPRLAAALADGPPVVALAGAP
jgi:Flp pilus assembly protein CpaB